MKRLCVRRRYKASSIPEYNVGIMTRVNSVLMVSPPITVMANGAPSPDTYSPCPMAKGIMATIVVMAVIRIGLKRDNPAVMMARCLRFPVRRSKEV